ncbi:transglycosylase domain-containing protein [Rubricoccus marinus]|nr:transglycosylase domain-containing protein [Rubricoccus marinus]
MSTTATEPSPTPTRRMAGWARRTASGAARGLGRGAARAGGGFWRWSGTRWERVRDAEAQRSARLFNLAALLAGWGAALGGAVFTLVLLYALFLIPFTPRVATLEQALEIHPSVAISADGTELTEYARGGREWVELEDISPHVIDALLATEDRRFYSHGGIDLRRTAGAVVRTLSGDREGGSSITQQLAKNLFPQAIGNDASLKRKLKEAITAIKIERVYEKDQILEIYLNSVPFLYNAIGIERAARTYFSKGADDLTLVESATLVAMLKGTSYYNPRRNPERALRRRNLVLRLMVDDGRLEAPEAERLSQQPLALRFERQTIQASLAPHFTEHVRREMEAWADKNGYNLYGDGLRVYTTLDWRLQRAATESVRKFGDALQTVADVEWGRTSASRLGSTTSPYYRAASGVTAFGHYWESKTAVVDQFIRESAEFERETAGGATPEAAIASLRGDATFMANLKNAKTKLQVGFSAIDPHSGAIRVWVGSRGYREAPFDHVLRARRQPGSTFKPFVYARALEEGWDPDDTLRDDSVRIQIDRDELWEPTDPDAASGELVTLRDGLALSRNRISAQLGQRVGARDVARLARRAGVNRSKLEAVPSIALGTEEVSLLEMTSAYATFAAAGLYHRPLAITRIEDRDGNVLEDFAPEARQALKPEVAHTLVDMLRGVVDRGTGRQLRSEFGVRADVAGKTGTTQDGVDGWFMAIHPDLAMGAWVGFDDPRVTFRSAYWQQGGHNALRVVGDFSRTALRSGLLSARPRFPETPEPSSGGIRDWFDGIFGGDEEPAPEARRQERPRRPARPDRAPERSSPEADAVADAVEEALRDIDPEARRAIDDAARQLEREADRLARDAERAAREIEREGARALREAARDIFR